MGGGRTGIAGERIVHVSDQEEDPTYSDGLYYLEYIGKLRRESSVEEINKGVGDGIIFPLEVEGVCTTAYLDTGCENAQYIDERFAREHGIPNFPVQGQIRLGDTRITVPRRGRKPKLKIRTESHEAECCFELMTLRYPVFVGVKLAFSLGIGFHGLPIRSTQFTPPKDQPLQRVASLMRIRNWL